MKNFILDIDGTLWDSTGVVAVGWNRALKEAAVPELDGLVITADSLKKEFGKPLDVIADELFRISLAYQHGYEMLPQDNKKAMEYCLKAASRGHAVAQLFAAQWLMRFHDDSNKEVMDWLMKAAEQGE